MKQFSAECLTDCRTYLIPLFERVDYILFKKFVKWVIKKYELITLRLDKPKESWVTQKAVQDCKHFESNFRTMIHNLKQEKQNIGFTPAQREDGRHGILILQRIEDVNRKVLVFKDDYNEVIMMTCNLMSMKWKSKIHSKQLLNEDLPLQNTIEHLIENS